MMHLQIAIGNLPREWMCWDVAKDKAVRVAIPFWHKVSTVLLFTLNFLQCCRSSSSVISDEKNKYFERIRVVPPHKNIVIYSSGSSGQVGEGLKNMKSMLPPLAAIFLMTYFYRAGGGVAPLASWIRYWYMKQRKHGQKYPRQWNSFLICTWLLQLYGIGWLNLEKCIEMDF